VPINTTTTIRTRKRCRFIFNEIKKLHVPIEYELKTSNSSLDGFNLRLSNLLRESYYTYPRRYVFLAKNSWGKNRVSDRQVKPETVSNWVRNIYNNKNLGIDGFRSSFVTYYLPKMNNLEKKVMATRMRTSVATMYRSYLKFIYTSSDTLVRVKEEPDAKLDAQAAMGKDRAGAVDVDKRPEAAIDIYNLQNDLQNNSRIRPPLQIPQRGKNNRENFKTWYKKPGNKEKHADNVMKYAKNNTEKIYAQRMVRELNKKMYIQTCAQN
jgi:hypothetical protein